MIGRRYDVDVDRLLDFNNPHWEEAIKSHTLKAGFLHQPTGVDYFIFSKGIFNTVLPFVLGRTIWDGWLVYQARSLGAPLIDATQDIWAIHQNHDYPAYLEGKDGVWKGNEAQYNQRLASGHSRNISNATHVLKNGRIYKRRLYLLFEPLILALK